MDIVFAYLAGLLTLINPCVLPVLPIVVASSLQADRRAPLFLAAGMSVSFVFLGLGVAAIGPGLGITEDVVSRTAAARRVFNAARQRCLPSPLPRLKPNAC
jgi:cytochrome c biogenesis protein CcdA